MSNEIKNHPEVILKMPKGNLALLNYATAVHDHLLGNDKLPSPNPPLPVFLALIVAFTKAETLAATRAKGTAAQRNAAKKKVKDALRHERDYVQSVAEVQESPAQAVAIIESAFMSVKKRTKRDKPELAIRNTGIPGKVVIDAKVVARLASYYWEYSEDGENWVTVPETFHARTEISGLTPLRTYFFRFRVRTVKGMGDYSQVVSAVVL